MYIPAKTKFKKERKGRNKGFSFSGSKLNFGTVGLISIGRGRITSKQIESGRIAINRNIKRGGKMWTNIFPNKPVTKKPLEVRMGKGKGPVEGFVFVIQPGRVIYEIIGIEKDKAKIAMKMASAKLPFKTKIIFYKN